MVIVVVEIAVIGVVVVIIISSCISHFEGAGKCRGQRIFAKSNDIPYML